jgi:ubiquinone/menaquinone biosynthesis C-methylase UbiE
MKACGERKPYTIPLPAKLIKFIQGKPTKIVLEIGCGYGRACLFLHEHGLNAVGVDSDRAEIRLASEDTKRRKIRQGITLVVNDARDLCFPDSSFDAVTMLGVLTLVPKSARPRIMNEVDRILRPSGYVFVEEFGRTWENPVYKKRYRDDAKVTGEMGTVTVRDESGMILHFGHHFTRQEIRSLLKGFRIISFEEDVFTSYYHRNWVKGYTILVQKQAARGRRLCGTVQQV